MSAQPARPPSSFDAEVQANGQVSLLDAKQAGELLNVPASWCLAEARDDRIPHVRLGRYVRFDRGELVAWWTARLQGPRALRAGSGPVPRGRRAA